MSEIDETATKQGDGLLEGEARLINGHIMTGREWAANALHAVADACEVGMFPHNVSAFDLGRALSRALINYQRGEDVGYQEMLRGFEHVDNQRSPQ